MYVPRSLIISSLSPPPPCLGRHDVHKKRPHSTLAHNAYLFCLLSLLLAGFGGKHISFVRGKEGLFFPSSKVFSAVEPLPPLPHGDRSKKWRFKSPRHSRREKINERMKILQDLVPGCHKVTGKASILDEIINYLLALEHQVEFLSMMLEAVNSHVNLGMEGFPTKNIFNEGKFEMATMCIERDGDKYKEIWARATGLVCTINLAIS